MDLKALVAATAKAGMPAVAVTDQSNMFALVKFYKTALGKGVKPIAGVDLWLGNEENTNAPFRLLLLVQDRVGYNNLTRLVSRGYREGQHLGRAMVERGWLEGNTDGLIALSGGRGGDVGRVLSHPYGFVDRIATNPPGADLRASPVGVRRRDAPSTNPPGADLDAPLGAPAG